MPETLVGVHTQRDLIKQEKTSIIDALLIIHVKDR